METQTLAGEPGVKPKARTRHPAQERVCVLVLGMHRSGTSTLTRTLSLLGCDMPRILVPANSNNEAGYWKSKAVIDLDNRMLESAGSQWDDWREVNPGWFASPKAAEFREEAVQLLQTEVGRSHLFALKDPRICRLAPFWMEVLKTQDISPRVMLPIRNPLEVAASVSRMKGIHPLVVHLIWLRHVLDAERFSRGMRRHISSYGGLLKDWRPLASDGARALGLSWPRLSEQAGHEITAFLSDKYRHHQESAQALLDDPFRSPWIRDTFRVLERWASDGEAVADHAALDRIRAEFDAASPAFSAALTEGVQSAKKLASMRRDFAAARAAIEERQQAGKQQSTETQDMQRQLVDLRQQLAQASQALEQRAQQESAATRQARDWQSRAEAAGRELATANTRLSQLEAAAGRSREDADRTAAALAEARAQRATAQVLADSRDEALRLQGVQLRAIEAELSDVRARSKEWREHAEALGRELGEARNRLAVADSAAARQREDAERSATALAEARGQLAAAQANLSTREEELHLRALQAAEFQAELAAARQAGVEASTTVGELRGQLAQSQRAAAELQREGAQSAAALAAAMQEQADLRTRLTQVEEAVAMHRSAAEQSATALAEARARLATAGAAAASQGEALQQQAARAAQAEAGLATAHSELSQALASFRDTKAQLAATGSELAAAREDAAVAAQALEQRALELETAAREATRWQETARATHEQLQVANTRLAQAKAEAASLHDSAATAGAALETTQREKQALTRRLCAQEARLADLEHDKRVADKVIAGLKERLAALIDEGVRETARLRAAQRAELASREEAIARIEASLARAQKDLAAARNQLSRELETSLWLRKTASILSNGTESRKGRLWGMAPANWRRAKQMRQLKQEGLFDAEAYAAANPDVAQKGQDPLRHYVRSGLKEGRTWRTSKTS